jgi:pilus assembly protein CpaC
VYNFNHAPAALRHTGRISRACVSFARLARATTLSVTVLLASAVLPGTAWNAVALEKASEHSIKVTGSTRTAMVNVSIGKSADVRTDAPFVDITVADPEIADVNPLTDRAISILGKKDGTTRVSVYAQDRKLVGVFDVAVSYDTTLLSREIQNRFPHANLRVTTVNGKLMVAGNAPDATTVDEAITIAKQFGPDVINMVSVNAPQQVMLEVRFIEASRKAGRDLGVQWNFFGKGATANVGSSQPAGSLPLPAPASSSALSVGETAAGVLSGGSPFGFAVGRFIAEGVTADVLVNALEQKGLARSLAEPNLVALSGDTASFLAGGEFPVPVPGSLGQVSIEYKRYGVGLAFTPTVLGRGLINLKIEPEVSQLDLSHPVQVAGISVPPLIVRRASTTVELRDGQSFVIGGLLQNHNATDQQQVPWLGDVPVLGTLFRSASYQRDETDLAIIVTPRLVRPTRPGDTVRDPLDSTLPANDAEFFLLGKSEIKKKNAREATSGALPFTGHILDLPKGGAVVSARN